MAERNPNVPIEHDKLELQIITSFEHLIHCISERRDQILAQYRQKRDERQALTESLFIKKRDNAVEAETARKETFKQLNETKLGLEDKMKNNNLHSTLDKMLGDIDFKLKILELEESDVKAEKLIFEYDVSDLEKIISQFGRIASDNKLVQPENTGSSNSCSYCALYDYEASEPRELSFRKGARFNILDSQGIWWLARDPVSGREGYIPSNYVAIVEEKIQVSDAVKDDNSATEKGLSTPNLAQKVFPDRITPAKLDSQALQHNNKAIKPDNYCDIDVLPSLSTNGEQQNGKKLNIVEQTKQFNKIESYYKYRWFFGYIKRSDAEKKLLAPGNAQGTFLVRESETISGSYSLSIRDQDSVKHYRINNLDSGGFFIAMERPFLTLNDLVTHYTANADGFFSRLTVPCHENQQSDRFIIPSSRLKLNRRPVTGEFGKVGTGVWTCKVTCTRLCHDTMPLEDLLFEARMMKILHHENLIQVHGVASLDKCNYVVTEYMERGDLLSYLQKEGEAKLKIYELIDIGAQVAAGMNYLIKYSFIHKNLAARNVMLGFANQVKVANFHLPCAIKDLIKANTETVKWIAPEVFEHNRFSIQSDVWSFGILLMEIITLGKSPYPGVKNLQVPIEVRFPRNYRMPMPQGCPEYLYRIMLDCWNANPEKRPTFETLKSKLKDFYVLSETKDKIALRQSTLAMHRDAWEVDRSCLKLENKLWKGQFTEIWEGVWNKDTRVAIKSSRPDNISREYFHNEMIMLKKLHHENLIQLVAICTFEEPIYIVTEYMTKGPLLEFLQKRNGAKLKEQELINVGAQVAAGMAHLQMHHCIHMNLTAQSVLVGEANQIKVADFGMVRVIDGDFHKTGTKEKLPLKWTSPETAQSRRYTTKSDVWSFGVLLMEIITLGRIPYPRMTNAEVLVKTAPPHNYRMPIPEGCPCYLYQIMLNCWKEKDYARPTFETLKYQLEDFYVAAEKPFVWM